VKIFSTAAFWLEYSAGTVKPVFCTVTPAKEEDAPPRRVRDRIQQRRIAKRCPWGFPFISSGFIWPRGMWFSNQHT
jgi:hypothetical protein